jgi:hypothetical protein
MADAPPAAKSDAGQKDMEIKYYVEMLPNNEPGDMFRSIVTPQSWWCERLIAGGHWEPDMDVYAMVISGQPGVHPVNEATFAKLARQYAGAQTLDPPKNPFHGPLPSDADQSEGGDSDGGTNPDEPPAPPGAGGDGS